ncbi:Lrp/AsnC family transcriptional regulator [Catellatospora sp. KI3]|uniref:Lrp/AsnC family transcriptional regulator n=1 Tax=Catellatospora sp. KI3 TaxID=3041620 RepID=UPI0024827FFA|nr:Lrp/AsnC family transcriptional regulator [Catellatospora sp. KI3]MDI1462489.1 Lrp/AsnC family transcriptional regulator [Catellatospora sp. KI3]
MELDATDRALIRRLQADGRASYTELGQEVGLSGPAVRQRIQRLTDSGVVQIAAVTDPLKIGLPVMALIGIRTSRSADEVAAALGAIDSVVYLVATAGSYDLFAEVVCASMGELSAIINDRIRAVDGVEAIESFPYFGIHVHRFTWGVPG